MYFCHIKLSCIYPQKNFLNSIAYELILDKFSSIITSLSMRLTWTVTGSSATSGVPPKPSSASAIPCAWSTVCPLWNTRRDEEGRTINGWEIRRNLPNGRSFAVPLTERSYRNPRILRRCLRCCARMGGRSSRENIAACAGLVRRVSKDWIPWATVIRKMPCVRC